MEADRSSNSSAKLKLKGILARRITRRSDNIARQILLLAAHIKIAQHELQDSLQRKFQPGEHPTKINSLLLKTLKWTAQFFLGADKVLSSALKYIKKANALLTFPLLHSKRGRRLLKRLPGGETTVALCESFGKLLSVSRIAVKDVLEDSAKVASALVDHRFDSLLVWDSMNEIYGGEMLAIDFSSSAVCFPWRYRSGEEAAQATKNILAILGHLMHVLGKSLEVLDPINLPLMEMGIEPFDSIYEDIGLDDLQEIIDEHKIEVLPETLELIKKRVDWMEAVGVEKKESPANKQSRQLDL